jgi:hypothetical protein
MPISSQTNPDHNDRADLSQLHPALGVLAEDSAD